MHARSLPMNRMAHPIPTILPERLCVYNFFTGSFQYQFFFVAGLYPAHNTGFNTKWPCSGHYFFRSNFIGEYFHTMPHIEYLVHFAAVGAGSLLDQLKNDGRVKQVVFYDAEIAGQVFQTFGLSAPAAMDK